MKTQILQLEAHDDIISARDRMGWGQTSRIVLVWPAGARVLSRRLDLVLIQRHSASLGAQLALVTRDPDVRYHARELRIPVFKTLKEAQRSRWRTSRRRRFRIRRSHPRPDYRSISESFRPAAPRWTNHPAARLGFFSLGVLSLLIILSYFIPGAVIELHPKTSFQETSLAVSAGEVYDAVTLSGELPISYLNVIVEGRDVITSTGRVLVPERYATGFARFTNLTTQRIEVPKGLVIESLKTERQDKISFHTTSSGWIPAGSGKSIVLPVRALSPGAQGNLPHLSLVAIEGPLGLKLSVTNNVATGGGENRAFPAPAAKDYAALNQKLTSTLQETALEELRTKAAGGYVIEPSITTSEVLEESFFPPLNEAGKSSPAEELLLTLRLEFQVQVVSAHDLETLSARLLDASLPEGSLPVPQSIQIDHLTTPVVGENGAYRWRVEVKRLLQREINPNDAALAASGLSQESAVDALVSTLPLAGPPEIKLTPQWWPRLPFFPYRIDIRQSP